MNEYIAILVFVCLPATVLLVAVIVVRALRRQRTYAKFPEYWVEVRAITPSEGQGSVVYKYRDEPLIEFLTYCERGRLTGHTLLEIEMPASVSDENVERVLWDLTEALQKMRYEYVVYRGKRSVNEVLAKSGG